VDYLQTAIKKGIYSAYFFLGVMSLEGIFVDKNP
jgi:TPR repeat protein